MNTIAVDLTPVLPGGDNGGAKVFVLELLCRLTEIAPQTQFVLLTQAASHDELSALDRPNVRRLKVLETTVANVWRPHLKVWASHLLPHLPALLRGLIRGVGYSFNRTLKLNFYSNAPLRGLGADLLFCPFTALTFFEPGIPTVCTIHDLQYKTYPEFFAPEDVSHRDSVFLDACQRATILTAVSSYTRKAAIQHGNINPDRICTIQHRIGKRLSHEAGQDNGVLEQLGLTTGQYFIYPANFWKHKNHEILLTAFGMACHGELAADIKLVCTGTPGARQELLISAALTMNLGDRILFPGYLPNAELAALMTNCAGMVFPSLYEGFGLPVIEAMAAGVPVACSNTTSLPEVASDAAILFDPRVPTQIAQAMIALVKDESLRGQFIEAQKQRAAEFSDSKRMAQEYLDIFRYALKKHVPRNLIIGTYADGWTGPNLSIQVAPAEGGQTLEIEFLASEWLPHPKVIVKLSHVGETLGLQIALSRGSSGVLSLPVEPTGGYYTVHISPTFVPANSGSGDDERELAVLFKRCVLIDASANCIEVERFPR